VPPVSFVMQTTQRSGILRCLRFPQGRELLWFALYSFHKCLSEAPRSPPRGFFTRGRGAPVQRYRQPAL